MPPEAVHDDPLAALIVCRRQQSAIERAAVACWTETKSHPRDEEEPRCAAHVCDAVGAGGPDFDEGKHASRRSHSVCSCGPDSIVERGCPAIGADPLCRQRSPQADRGGAWGTSRRAHHAITEVDSRGRALLA